ncbi:MAG: CbtA family protein [Acidobacteria bacterium]|nr:CbtA family protein [Acidobacteriota bacterium]
MTMFRKLVLVVLCSGVLAGLLLFAMQHFTVVPLIEAAERYEHEHAVEEWKPAEGLERTAWTALTSVLTGIGFAAVLFGFLALSGRDVSVRQGLLWGVAAFACFHLAPSLGLPPLPPGVPVPDVQDRQIWWTFTVLATAVGLWLIACRTWMRSIAGVLCLLLPHLIGAPTVAGEAALPVELLRNFTIASLATTGVFWPMLGAIGGFVSSRLP